MTRLLIAALVLSANGVATAQTCTVSAVNDGESMRVNCPGEKESIRLRLAQIDAPALEQQHGKRARRFLRFICPVGMKVQVERHGQDQRKRTLATVTCNDINANVAMVMAGHAWACRRHSKAAALHEIQQQAQTNRMGLWRHPDPVPPWEFKAMNR